MTYPVGIGEGGNRSNWEGRGGRKNGIREPLACFSETWGFPSILQVPLSGQG